MMKLTFLLPFAFALWGSVVARGDCHLTKCKTTPGECKIILENERLRCIVDLHSSGRMESLFLKETGEEFLVPLKETVDNYSPLVPPFVRSNNGGIKDLLWKQTVSKRSPFTAEIKEETAERITLIINGELGLFDLVRTVSLEKDSSIIRQEITITNRSSSNEDLSYWIHALLNPAVFQDPATGEGVMTLPSAGSQVIRSKKTEAIPEGITTLRLRNYGFYALTEGWCGRIAPQSGSCLLVEFRKQTIEPDGMISAWDAPGSTSLEVLLATRSLAPGEGAQFDFAIAAVPKVGFIAGYAADFLLDVVEDSLRVRFLGHQNEGQSGVLSLPAGGDKERSIELNELRSTVKAIGTIRDLKAGEWVLSLKDKPSIKASFSPAGGISK